MCPDVTRSRGAIRRGPAGALLSISPRTRDTHTATSTGGDPHPRESDHTMSNLVALGVATTDIAERGFEQILHLHAVALLTLHGIAILAADSDGVTAVVDSPPNQVGVDKVEVSPAFPAILSLISGETGSTASLLPDDAVSDIRRIVRPGRSVIVYLADDIAEGEVSRQLEFLEAERLALTLTTDQLESLAPAK
jgi:uncharacterized membrane protein